MKSLRSSIMPVLALQHECIGCMACIDICPKHAIFSYMGLDGHRYVKVDREKCVGCKKCEKICKLSRGNYGENNIHKSNIYAAWNKDILERRMSTSGGVFSATAKTILKRGGVVVGASLSGRECRHILIRNVDEIPLLQGSKYMSSTMEGIYKTVEQEIKNSIVLFSGLPCQCAGMLAYFENHPNRDNLITMDLVCGGTPSRILIDKFYQRFPEVERIVSFRKKDKYKLKVKINNDVISVNEKNLPLHGFNCDMTNRLCCYNCKFAVTHRKTDYTIGDLWNYNIYPKEHYKGISTLIVHSEKGNEILKDSEIELHEINWGDSIKFCRRIASGKRHIFRPREKLVENSRNMEYDDFLKLYCIDMGPKDITMFLFRVYRYIITKLEFIIIDIKLNKILK